MDLEFEGEDVAVVVLADVVLRERTTCLGNAWPFNPGQNSVPLVGRKRPGCS